MAIPKGSGFRGRHGLGEVRTVQQFREFLGETAGLTRSQRETLVDQAESGYPLYSSNAHRHVWS